jgi:hypothetical protein
MSKNIFEELPSRKGTPAVAQSAPDKRDEKGGDPRENSADPKVKSQKRIRQAIYDIRYRARREDITLGQAFSNYMQNSNLSPMEKSAVKSQITEDYEIGELVSDSLAESLYRVFVLGEKKTSDIDVRDQYLEELNAIKERKYHVRVTDKNTKKTYYRYATREKINKLRANPNISSVEMLDKMAQEYGKTYEGERKSGEQTAAVTSGRGLDAVGKEDSDVDNDGKKNDPNDKYLLNRRKKIGDAMKTRMEALDPVGQEDDDIDNDGKKNTKNDKYLKNRRNVRGAAIANEEFLGEVNKDSNNKQITGKGVDNYKSGVVKISPTDSDSDDPRVRRIRKESSAFRKFISAIELDEMGMPILGVVKKDSAKKEGPSCDTNSDDMRSLPTKVNLIKNKMRAMGLKMSYEPEGKQIDEIAPLVAAGLAAGAALAGGAVIKRSQDAAKSGVDAAKKGQKIKPGIGIGNAAYGMQKHNDALKDAMKQHNSYEPEGEMVDEARAEEKRGFGSTGTQRQRQKKGVTTPYGEVAHPATSYSGGQNPQLRGKEGKTKEQRREASRRYVDQPGGVYAKPENKQGEGRYAAKQAKKRPDLGSRFD